MAEGVGCIVDSENDSFQSQNTHRLPSLHVNHFCAKEIRECMGVASRSVHTASQHVYADGHDNRKDCSSISKIRQFNIVQLQGKCPCIVSARLGINSASLYRLQLFVACTILR